MVVSLCLVDGLASAVRADALYELPTESHVFVVGRSSQGHEWLCDGAR